MFSKTRAEGGGEMAKKIERPVPRLITIIAVQLVAVIGIYILLDKNFGERGVMCFFAPSVLFCIFSSMKWSELRTTTFIQFALASSCFGVAFTAHEQLVGLAFMVVGVIIGSLTFSTVEKDPSIWNLPAWGEIDER